MYIPLSYFRIALGFFGLFIVAYMTIELGVEIFFERQGIDLGMYYLPHTILIMIMNCGILTVIFYIMYSKVKCKQTSKKRNYGYQFDDLFISQQTKILSTS